MPTCTFSQAHIFIGHTGWNETYMKRLLCKAISEQLLHHKHVNKITLMFCRLTRFSVNISMGAPNKSEIQDSMKQWTCLHACMFAKRKRDRRSNQVWCNMKIFRRCHYQMSGTSLKSQQSHHSLVPLILFSFVLLGHTFIQTSWRFLNVSCPTCHMFRLFWALWATKKLWQQWRRFWTKGEKYFTFNVWEVNGNKINYVG